MAKRRARTNPIFRKTATVARASKDFVFDKESRRIALFAAAPNAAVTNLRTAHCSFLIPEGDAPPEWIELLPARKFSANDGRGPWTSDPDKVLAATQKYRAEQPIDYDHAFDLAAPEGRPSPAAGWIKEWKRQGDAILGRVEWTPAAAQKIKDREYRFISPVFAFDPTDPNDAQCASGEVLFIKHAALTNNPALDMTALAAAQAARIKTARSASEDTEMADTSNDGAAEDMNLSKIVATLEKAFPKLPKSRILQIAQEAIGDGDTDDAMNASDDDGMGGESEDEMAARHAGEMAKCSSQEQKTETATRQAKEKDAMKIRTARASSRPQHATALTAEAVAKHPIVVKLAETVSKLQRERNEEKAAEIVAAAMRDRKITPALKDWAVAYCTTDPEGFTKFIGAAPALLPDGGFESPTPGVNKDGSAALSQKEIAMCSQLRIDPVKYAKNKATTNGSVTAIAHAH